MENLHSATPMPEGSACYSRDGAEGKNVNDGIGISIALAVYNGARFISEQLASFAGQTRLPDELVVCDNCSTDRTVEIVRNFASGSPFPVRLYVNEQNLGAGRNFGRAMSECAGDIIFLSDCDDVWYPDKLRVMTQVLQATPEVALVECDADVVDRDLRPRGYTTGSLPRQQCFPFSIVPPSFVGNSLAFRARFRSVILPMPASPIFLKGHHDSWLGLVIVACGGRAAFVPQALLAYRQHETQQIGAFPKRLTERLSRSLRGRVALRCEPFEVLLAALEARIESPDPKVLRELRSFVAHLRARRDLPDARLARLPIVMKELTRFRYSRYSQGVLSAIKDLVL